MEKEINNTGKKSEIKGVVIGNKMDKTVRIRVDTVEEHPVYKKIIKRKKVYFAHTNEDLEVGDIVTIRESRPISKKVRWLVVKKEE